MEAGTASGETRGRRQDLQLGWPYEARRQLAGDGRRRRRRLPRRPKRSRFLWAVQPGGYYNAADILLNNFNGGPSFPAVAEVKVWRPCSGYLLPIILGKELAGRGSPTRLHAALVQDAAGFCNHLRIPA